MLAEIFSGTVFSYSWAGSGNLQWCKKTKQSAKSINNRLINRGYWDSEVKTSVKRDSATKAEVDYVITHKDPTYIKEYFYNIPDQNVRSIYESQINKSFVKKGRSLMKLYWKKKLPGLMTRWKKRVIINSIMIIRISILSQILYKAERMYLLQWTLSKILSVHLTERPIGKLRCFCCQ